MSLLDRRWSEYDSPRQLHRGIREGGTSGVWRYSRRTPYGRIDPPAGRQMRIRLRDGRERFILRKAPDETARDEPQPHTALVGE